MYVTRSLRHRVRQARLRPNEVIKRVFNFFSSSRYTSVFFPLQIRLVKIRVATTRRRISFLFFSRFVSSEVSSETETFRPPLAKNSTPISRPLFVSPQHQHELPERLSPRLPLRLSTNFRFVLRVAATTTQAVSLVGVYLKNTYFRRQTRASTLIFFSSIASLYEF